MYTCLYLLVYMCINNFYKIYILFIIHLYYIYVYIIWCIYTYIYLQQRRMLPVPTVCICYLYFIFVFLFYFCLCVCICLSLFVFVFLLLLFRSLLFFHMSAFDFSPPTTADVFLFSSEAEGKEVLNNPAVYELNKYETLNPKP